MSILSDLIPGKRRLANDGSARVIDRTTGLASRSRVIEGLEEALKMARRKRPVSLLILDVSNIAADLPGDDDPLLPKLGQVLASWLPARHLLGRLRDHEFAVVVCDGAAPGSVESLAQGAIHQIRESPLLASAHKSISTLVGISVSTRADCTASELLRHADIALSRARASGRGHYMVVDHLPLN